jgi:hypothetical protein
MATFLLYPSLTTTTFGMFRCRALDANLEVHLYSCIPI